MLLPAMVVLLFIILYKSLINYLPTIKRQSLSPSETQSKRLKGKDTRIWTGKMVKNGTLSINPMVPNKQVKRLYSFTLLVKMRSCYYFILQFLRLNVQQKNSFYAFLLFRAICKLKIPTTIYFMEKSYFPLFLTAWCKYIFSLEYPNFCLQRNFKNFGNIFIWWIGDIYEWRNKSRKSV